MKEGCRGPFHLHVRLSRSSQFEFTAIEVVVEICNVLVGEQYLEHPQSYPKPLSP